MAYPYQKHIWVTREIIRREYLQNIEDGIYDEQQERLLAEGALEQAISDEEDRAKSAENTLDLAIQTETTRAQGAESDLEDLVETEEQRALDAESILADDILSLDTRISNEYTRATTVETSLSDSVLSETTRALAAEAALQNDINTKIAGAYKPSGSLYFADLPTLELANLGKVYYVMDAFTTTADFIEGAGIDYPAGTYVAIIYNDDPTVLAYMYDAMTGMVDTSMFVQKTDYATTSSAGIVKPDGTTTSVDANGVITVIGGSGGGGGGSSWVGTCTSAADAQTKAVTVDNEFELEVGARICVKFTNSNSYSATAENKVSLNVNNTGARNIYYNNSNAPTGTNTNVFGYANRYIFYVFDGTNWVWDGSGIDNNTTYSAMSVSELTTGTATSQRTVRADYLHTAIQTMIDDSVGAAMAASY